MVWVPILTKALPVVLLLSAGVLVRKIGLLSEPTVAQLKRFVVNLALPALLFMAFLNTGFQIEHFWIIGLTFAVNFVMLGVGKAFGLLIDRTNPYLPLMFTGFEMGMLGFSLFGTVYGTTSLGILGIFDIGQEIYVWFVLTTLLSNLNSGRPNPKGTLRSFATSPVIIAIALGVGLNLSGLRPAMASNALVGSLLSTISMVAQLTIPLILIIIGFQLGFRLRGTGAPLMTLLVRMSVLVGLAIPIDRVVLDGLLHLPELFRKALFTMFVLPPPFIVPLFMDKPKAEDQDYVTKTLALGTLLTIIAFILTVVALA